MKGKNKQRKKKEEEESYSQTVVRGLPTKTIWIS